MLNLLFIICKILIIFIWLQTYKNVLLKKENTVILNNYINTTRVSHLSHPLVCGDIPNLVGTFHNM